MTTKEKILEVVINHIKEGTINQVSLMNIAQAADIAKSTLYEYFSSKDDMIEQTYRYMLTHYEHRLLKPLKSHHYKAMFIEQLNEMIDITLEASKIMEAIMSSSNTEWMQLPSCMHETMKTMKSKVDQRFNEIFQKGINEGVLEINNHSPYLKHVLKAMMSGLLMQYVHDQLALSKQEFIEFLILHLEWLMSNQTPYIK